MTTEEFIGLFHRELFLPDLRARDRMEVLDELVERLIQAGEVQDKELLLELLENRERLGSTGIGEGVAIPHCRSLVVDELTVVFGKSRYGIDFEAMDGRPAHLFFLVVAPPQDKGNRYLPFLGKTVEVIKDAEVRSELMAATSFEQFIGVLLKSQN